MGARGALKASKSLLLIHLRQLFPPYFTLENDQQAY